MTRFIFLLFSSFAILSGGEWSPVCNISGKDVETFEVASNANGQIWAVWLRSEFEESQQYKGCYYSARKYMETCFRQEDKSWSAPEIIEGEDFLAATKQFEKKLSLQLDDQGNPTVFLSRKSKDIGFRVYSKQKVAGRPWDDWEEIPFPGKKFLDFALPSVTVDSLGILYTTWSIRQGEYKDVLYHRKKRVEVSEKEVGSEWGVPTYLNPTSQYYYLEENPKIRSDSIGNVYCFWEGYDRGTPIIKCSEKSLGGE